VESEVGSGSEVRKERGRVRWRSGGKGSEEEAGVRVREEGSEVRDQGLRVACGPAGGANQPTSKSLVTFPILDPQSFNSTKLTKPPKV